ncbi:biotin transporter BioY [Microcella sp.]|uniref:biotin transporter BioY n=1 Tax=Microcella sp. TaxID=1913979 RepID=UPI00391A7121
MSLAAPLSGPTLADRVIPRTLVTDIALVAAGAGLTAAAAQVIIPAWPVPFTGQTFAVLLVGASLGMTRGALSMGLYALLGLVGLPVFAPQADGSHLTGLAALAAPSFGYIVGFVAAAAIMGWFAQQKWDRKILKTLVALVASTLIIYAFGLSWLGVVLAQLGVENVLATTISAGLLPFLVGDAIKALLAAALLPAAWWAISRADRAAGRN